MEFGITVYRTDPVFDSLLGDQTVKTIFRNLLTLAEGSGILVTADDQKHSA